MSEFDKFFGCVKKTLTFNIEKECITYLISKGLSIGIVLFSFTSKLPQIIYMYKSKDIKGLSFLSIYFEIFSCLCSALYPIHMKYPFLTFGESVIILIENIIIFFLTWKYDINQTTDKKNMTFTFICIGFLYVCSRDVLDEKCWKIIGSASTVLNIISRFTQIINSYKVQSTGPLSTITFGLNMLGNLARIFTTLKETKDVIITSSFVVSFILNLIIFCQILYYNKKNKKDEGKEDGDDEKEKKKSE